MLRFKLPQITLEQLLICFFYFFGAHFYFLSTTISDHYLLFMWVVLLSPLIFLFASTVNMPIYAQQQKTNNLKRDEA